MRFDQDYDDFIEHIKTKNGSLGPTELSKKEILLTWMVNYLVVENFPAEHLDALCRIIGLFNDCKEHDNEDVMRIFATQMYKTGRTNKLIREDYHDRRRKRLDRTKRTAS